jgi:hypothetical protein
VSSHWGGGHDGGHLILDYRALRLLVNADRREPELTPGQQPLSDSEPHGQAGELIEEHRIIYPRQI